jgi:hypothetical protein
VSQTILHHFKFSIEFSHSKTDGNDQSNGKVRRGSFYAYCIPEKQELIISVSRFVSFFFKFLASWKASKIVKKEKEKNSYS